MGIDISTFTNTSGNVFYSCIEAPNSPLFVVTTDEIIFRTGDAKTDYVYFKEDGKVGIGTDMPDSELTVAGKIHAQEVKVTIGAGIGADFVFDESYDLPSLKEIETFIEKNNHLPDIPSAKQMQEEGLNLGDMQIKLLQKVEELTLYMIELKKENVLMKEEICELKKN